MLLITFCLIFKFKKMKKIHKTDNLNKAYKTQTYKNSKRLTKVLFAIMDGKCNPSTVEFYLPILNKAYKEEFGVEYEYDNFYAFKENVEKLQEYLEKKAIGYTLKH